MRVNYQVTVDCVEVHGQARFWAAALGWTVEDHSEIIQPLLDRGIATESDVTTIDGHLAWREFAAVRDPEAKVDEKGMPERGRLLFQVVPEPKTAKSRMHLDLHLAVDDRDAEVTRLIDLGAVKLWDGRLGTQTWITLADPEGNEFCVA